MSIKSESNCKMIVDVDFGAGGKSPFTDAEEERITGDTFKLANEMLRCFGVPITEDDYNQFQAPIETDVHAAAEFTPDWSPVVTIRFVSIGNRRWSEEDGGLSH